MHPEDEDDPDDFACVNEDFARDFRVMMESLLLAVLLLLSGWALLSAGRKMGNTLCKGLIGSKRSKAAGHGSLQSSAEDVRTAVAPPPRRHHASKNADIKKFLSVPSSSSTAGAAAGADPRQNQQMSNNGHELVRLQISNADSVVSEASQRSFRRGSDSLACASRSSVAIAASSQPRLRLDDALL
ncbi:unnamed protein product [Notodromas monacha]|uniref:Uncharacterized protein n=1 Tax=Notodromas monacha TaxID=399045 RepID=A0A7R9BPC0_9CRUS|nr:unnamed protein product [Notodromas monacha]CAG0918316.1 unnamed protein product [Notodromas monacha]